MFCILYFHLNWRQITKWLCSLDTLSRSNCQLVVRAFWHRLKDPDLIVHPASSPSGPGLVNRLKRKRRGNTELSSSWRRRFWNSMLWNYFVMFVQRSRLSSPLNLPRWLSVQVWSGVDGRQTLSTIQQSGLSRSLPEWLSPLFKSAFLWRDRLEGTKVEWRFGCEHTQSQNFLTDFFLAFIKIHYTQRNRKTAQVSDETMHWKVQHSPKNSLNGSKLPRMAWSCYFTDNSPHACWKKVPHWGAIDWSQCALAVCGNQIENFHLIKDLGARGCTEAQ